MAAALRKNSAAARLPLDLWCWKSPRKESESHGSRPCKIRPGTISDSARLASVYFRRADVMGVPSARGVVWANRAEADGRAEHRWSRFAAAGLPELWSHEEIGLSRRDRLSESDGAGESAGCGGGKKRYRRAVELARTRPRVLKIFTLDIQRPVASRFTPESGCGRRPGKSAVKGVRRMPRPSRAFVGTISSPAARGGWAGG